MADTKIFDTIDMNFLNAFHQASQTLYHSAYNLALYLAAITLALSAIIMLLRQEEVHNMLSKLLQSVLLFGAFFGLMTLCSDWVPKLLSSFMQIGGQAGHIQALDPSSVFDQGYVMASKIMQDTEKIHLTHLPTALLASICALFIVLIYAMMAATLVVVMVKSYALIAIGPIIFALGMSDFTRMNVTNYLAKLVGLGLNLVVLYIIIGTGVTMGEGWVTLINGAAGQSGIDFSDIYLVMGGVLVLYIVAQNVPAFIATLSGAMGFRDYGQATAAALMGASAMTVNTVMKTLGSPVAAGKFVAAAPKATQAGVDAGNAVIDGALGTMGIGPNAAKGAASSGGAVSSTVSAATNAAKTQGDSLSAAFTQKPAGGSKVNFDPNRDQGGAA